MTPDDEYELEPVDEHVIAQEKLRAKLEMERARTAIDVDKIYRDMGQSYDYGDGDGNQRPQFSLRNLLVATTLVAVALGLWQSGLLNGNAFAALIVLAMIVLGSLNIWLNARESRRRAELLAEHRRASLGPEEEGEHDEDNTLVNEVIEEIIPMGRFRVKDLLLAVAFAGVILSAVMAIGGLSQATATMGALAVVGFALQAAELRLPRFLVLSWWLALLAFAVLSAASLVAGG